MFKGENPCSIDEKGRFIMPVKLREAMSEGVVITRGLDGCLHMYDNEYWKIIEQKLAALPMTNRAARDFVRFFVSGAVDGCCDKQGRIPIPLNLRIYAGLEKNIVLAGAGNYLEIWDADAWKRRQISIMENPEDLAEQMADYGI